MRLDAFGRCNVSLLAAFIAASQKNDRYVVPPTEVDSVSWAEMKSAFVNAVTDEFHVTEIPKPHTFYAERYACPPGSVP